MIPTAVSPTAVPTTSPPAVVPLAIGRTDGWGSDDTLVVVLAVVALLATVAVVGALAPQHGGRVKQWRIMGRAPAGVAFCLAVLNIGMGLFLVRGATTGALLQGPVGVGLGLAAWLSSVLLIVGWWVRRLHRWMHHGLLVSAAVWGGVAAASIAAGLSVSGWIGLWLCVISAVAWIAEVTDDGGGSGEQ